MPLVKPENKNYRCIYKENGCHKLHRVTENSAYPIPNLTTDTHVSTVCHIQCTMTKDMHILIMTVLPHITFEYQSIPKNKVCTYRSTREVRRGKVI